MILRDISVAANYEKKILVVF